MPGLKPRPRGKEQTSTFSCEFALRLSNHDRRVLRSRFEAGRQLYNACLGDLLRRADAARATPEWAAASRLPKRVVVRDAKGERKRVPNPARRAAFQAVRERFGLSEYSAHTHPSLAPDCWIRTHLDANTSQKVATRAWRAVERHMYGRAGSPRFVPFTQPLDSLEGKGRAGIRLVEADDGRPPRVEWASRPTRHGAGFKLSLPLVVDSLDKVQAHALEHRVKYVRVLRKEIRGRERFSAQLVLEGLPLVKHASAEGVVALDIGPSDVAVVSEGNIFRCRLAQEVELREKARRRYQRQMDRQRRANNPTNYNENGTIRPGKRRWQKSRRQLQTERALREMERALAAGRKNSHGALANKILAQGSCVLAEKLSYKSFQKRWGKSVRFRAPGLFIALLARKANQTEGGAFIDIPTRETYLSSRCLCGKREKKALSNRWHACGCQYLPRDMRVQRDEFSAFLALFCGKGELDLQAAQAAWHTWGANCLPRSQNNEPGASGDVSPGKSTSNRQSCLADNGRGRRVRPERAFLPVLGEPVANRHLPGLGKDPPTSEIPRTLVLGNS